jgi:hypothetical protein
MKKILLFILIAFPFLTVCGQETAIERLPFVLLIDNEVPDPSYIHGVFLIKDSLNIVRDSVKFKYEVGSLTMTKPDYDKLFSVKQVNNIAIKLIQYGFNSDTTDTSYVYEYHIPNKYINQEYPNGFMNKTYFIFKIFNKFNIDSRTKYYFTKDENYIVQIIIPGSETLIPFLKKE